MERRDKWRVVVSTDTGAVFNLGKHASLREARSEALSALLIIPGALQSWVLNRSGEHVADFVRIEAGDAPCVHAH